MWDDPGSLLPRDASHQFVGIGGINDGTSLWRFNDWKAENI
jgi:hypothetical protein